MTSTLTRNGDLINRLHLKIELPAIPSCSTGLYQQLMKFINGLLDTKVGHNLIKNASVDIGGRLVDEQTENG